MPTFEKMLECSCWPEARLRERAKLWPTGPEHGGPDFVHWSWFLGERCAAYSDAEIQDEFTATAYAYLKLAKVRMPTRPGVLWTKRKSVEITVLLDVLSLLGDYLDRWDREGGPAADSEEYRLLEDAMQALTSA